MTKPPRKKPIPEIETSVLVRSARRCPVCFHLHRDLSVKVGQIAHLDGDRTNGAEDNLAWMCMPHHSEYDSTTSQHKNFTIGEVKQMRTLLYEAIAADRHAVYNAVNTAAAAAVAGRETDRQTLADLIELLGTTGTINFLRNVNFAAGPFSPRTTDAFDTFLWQSTNPEKEFIDPELEGLRQGLIGIVQDAIGQISLKTFVVSSNPTMLGLPREWDPQERQRAAEQLKTATDKVCAAYDGLVRSARARLAS